MPFTLDAQQTLNPIEHSSIYRQAAERLRTFLSRFRKPYSARASVHTNRASCSRTLGNSVRKQCSAGVNAPLYFKCAYNLPGNLFAVRRYDLREDFILCLKDLLFYKTMVKFNILRIHCGYTRAIFDIDASILSQMDLKDLFYIF